MTRGVDATKPPTWVKGKQTRHRTPCPKKQGAHPSTQEEAQAITGVDSTDHGSILQGEQGHSAGHSGAVLSDEGLPLDV